MQPEDPIAPLAEQALLSGPLAGLLSAGSQVFGTAGDDVLTGSVGPETLYGLAGDDLLVGSAGNDVLIGGPGADVQLGGAGDDIVYVGASDVVSPFGADGENFTNGGAGFDIAVLVGDGVDINAEFTSFEYIIGSEGNDQIFGSDSAATTIYAGGGDDELIGGEQDELINGGAGDDVLDGRNGDDRLEGGAGADRLVAGGGRDVLVGGAGSDVFELSYFKEFTTDLPYRNDVLDFVVGEDIVEIVTAGDDPNFELTATAEGALVQAVGGSLLLRGVDADSLGDDDIQFVDLIELEFAAFVQDQLRAEQEALAMEALGLEHTTDVNANDLSVEELIALEEIAARAESQGLDPDFGIF